MAVDSSVILLPYFIAIGALGRTDHILSCSIITVAL